ncbi:MAG: hypothetical protein ACO3LE_01240 [Bdellovibrionota bacterium]
MSSELEVQKESKSARYVAGILVEDLFKYFRLTQTHGRSNDIFKNVIDRVLQAIDDFPDESPSNQLEVIYKGEQIYVNDLRLKPHSRRLHFYRAVIKFLKSRRIAGFRITRDIKKEDLEAALWILSQIEPRNDQSVQEAIKSILTKRILGFEVIPFNSEAESADNTAIHSSELGTVAISLVKRIHEFVEICFFNSKQIDSFSIDPIDLVLVDLASLPEEELLACYRHFQERKSERYLTYFVTNVAVLLAAWGRALQLPIGVIAELAGAALAHGKLFVLRNEINMNSVSADERGMLLEMDSILERAWKLTDLQRLSQWEWSISFAKDGGYKSNLSSCYSHFFSRLIRIASWYGHKIHFLPNRSPLLPDEAMTSLIQTENEFDVTLLKLFVNWMGIYPVGTLVELQSGELAQIFSAGSDPLRFRRPIVSLLRDVDGNFLKRPLLLDLSDINDKLGVYKKSIKRSLKQGEVEIPEALLRLSPIGF